MAEKEVPVRKDELVISKTDLKGKITYANRSFMRISNFAEPEFLNRPHSIIRHPDMPRGVFYAVWKELQARREFFGLIKNYTRDKNYYWVFANITPDFVGDQVVGYFSVRRYAPRDALKVIEPIYSQMRAKEKSMSSSKAPEASWCWLTEMIQEQHHLSYNEFILNLYHEQLAGEGYAYK